MRSLVAVFVVLLGLIVLIAVRVLGFADAKPATPQLACGHYATPAPSGAPTPQSAPSASDLSRSQVPPVAVVGAWPTCFRPQVVTIIAGEVVQWQEVTTQASDVVLDSGLDLGPVLHVLEVRFNHPGRYPYHDATHPGTTGLVVVEGLAQPGPAFEVWSPTGHRTIEQAP